MHRAVFVLTALLLTTSAAPAASTLDWPGWRGPDGSGVSTRSGFPTRWSDEESLAWKVEIPGRGCSSPIVVGDRVIVTTAVAGEVVEGARAPTHLLNGEEFVHPLSEGADRAHRLEVRALELVTGRELWTRVVHDGRVYDDRHQKASYASPTPTADGERVYAYFGSQGLHCLTLDGEPVWRADVGKIATLGMGVGASPVLVDEMVVLQCDENLGERSFIVALDRRTGEERWRAARRVQVSWSTPVVVSADGSRAILASGNESIVAYDAGGGHELWRAPGIDSNAIHTPLPGVGFAIVSAGYPKKRVVALRTGSSAEEGEAPADGSASADDDRVLWSYDKGTAYVASPILLGELLYLVSDSGRLTCLGARDGRLVYEGVRLPGRGTVIASPVAFDDKVLISNDRGETFVVRAGAEHEVLAVNRIDEPILASLALSRGRVLLRGERHLWCFTSPEPAAKDADATRRES